MDFYTKSMMDIVGMPRYVNVNSKRVSPDILFSPAIAESLLYWQAASLSLRLHKSVLLGVEVVYSTSAVSFTELVSLKKEKFDGDGNNGLAYGLLLLAAAGEYIIKPARKHANFDYAPLITDFRAAVKKNYEPGQVLLPDDFNLNSVFYDNITKPNRDVRYSPPELSQGVKR
jgi:hypothetical protein